MSAFVVINIAGCSNSEDNQASGTNPDVFKDANGADGDNGNEDQLMPCTEFNFSAKFDVNASFPPWKSSPYHLPYKKGERYLVNQGNTSGFGHSGFWRFGYDFLMNIGTEVYAARSGRVVYTYDGARDGNRNATNLITVRHSDGTVALYSHLTEDGSFVEIGDAVERGQLIGLSGDTGNTGDIPHLHFSVHPCSGLPGLPNQANCPTQPVTFSNTEENPDGLGTGECYLAE
ncbi:M23 family metallopeptidase [Muricauda sp. CAU 1633]|uniref:M23 family metallopeptidase n=1 Tax=Allomuricauda sp. CAU 1633 TaxID=2816036 RepID=UPI001A8FC31A|nr:M23 family metallopeptidase [Muricauda sp. CAU 1633]MBO0321437.1 M23 family metallopeptidase [Muricauda sp. CAU 1633]